MTPTQRDWLRSVRRSVREAALHLDYQRYDVAFAGLRERFLEEVPASEVTSEVKNMIASLATAGPDLMDNIAARRAAVRRLDETNHFITESLLAAAEHNPGR